MAVSSRLNSPLIRSIFIIYFQPSDDDSDDSFNFGTSVRCSVAEAAAAVDF